MDLCDLCPNLVPRVYLIGYLNSTQKPKTIEYYYVEETKSLKN